MSIRRMTKGFVTLAVGDEKYYRLAANLLLSYRYHSNNPQPFAIIADRENSYTALFDKVVIISNPYKSYMDKIEMLVHPTFDYNIFIDADCLVYRDINTLLDVAFDGVTLYGSTFSLSENEKGWFQKDNLCEYEHRVDCILNTHGGIMFYRRDDVTKQIYDDCKNIVSHYSDFHFAMFEKPADEPIIALAMAANGCKPIERTEHYDVYGFFPTFKNYKLNIAKGLFAYTFDGNLWYDQVMICHWQNCNTLRPVYKIEIDRLKHGDGMFVLIFSIYRKLQFFYGYCVNKIKNVLTR